MNKYRLCIVEALDRFARSRISIIYSFKTMIQNALLPYLGIDSSSESDTMIT